MGFNAALAKELHGTTSFFQGQFNAVSVTIVICCALSLYNALMLLALVFITFRRFHGLYFWSLVIASAGVLPYCIGFMIEYFQLTSQIAGLVITSVGWPMMVTGQSLVLYSRLGVVMGPQYRSLLSAVKWMIIIDGVIFHVSTTVVDFGSYLAPPEYRFSQAYRYIEKMQMTGFTIQEFILSGLYVWRTLEILKTSDPDRKRTKRVMWQLFSINIMIIFFDVALLVVEYQNRHVIEQALKGVVYSIKLNFEFAVLSKLAGIGRGGGDSTFLGPFESYDDFIVRDRTDSVGEVHASTNAGASPRIHEGDAEKSKGLHVERISSVFSTQANGNGEQRTVAGMQSTFTIDQQQRRRTLEEDLYADACRDIGG